MAVIQLGALVTKIKGSIGGTAFKTQKSTQVMFRKSAGYSKNKLLLNNALQYARWIFTQWTFLTPEEKSSWNSLAAILFFTDKFGNSVHISGRQLYTKSNINLRNIEYYAEAPAEFNTLIPLVTVSNAVFDPSTMAAQLQLNRVDSQEVYIMVSAQISQNNLPEPVFSRREAFFITLNSSNAILDFGTELFAKFPYLTANYMVRYYIDIVNIFGIKGTPLWIDAVGQAIDYSFTAYDYTITSQGGTGFAVLTNVPAPVSVRVSAQYQAGTFPDPDFDAAEFVADRTLTSGGVVSMGYLLSKTPFNLQLGNKVRLWVEVRKPDMSYLPPQSIITDDEYPVISNQVTSALMTVTNAITGTVVYDIYNKPSNIVVEIGDEIELLVGFNYWDTGDPLPVNTLVAVDIEGMGAVGASDIAPFDEFNTTTKLYRYYTSSALFSLDNIVTVVTQEVPTA